MFINKFEVHHASYPITLSLTALCTLVAGSIYVVGIIDDVSALQYTNYTSSKYQIHFQYPVSWEIKEKAGRFEEGADIEIRNPTLGSGIVFIFYYTNLREGFSSTDLQTALYNSFKSTIGYDYSTDYKVIEQPSFISIGGYKAGTFLYTSKDKIEDYASLWANQDWIVFAGSTGYNMDFMATADLFDSPENIEFRDHFLKSINFLGQNNTVNTINSTSRFG